MVRISRMKNGSIMSCHLTMLSEKIEESLGNPLFPHSCFPLPSSSPFLLFPILFSFFLFMIYCFVLFYLADGHLGYQRGSCGLNRYFLFVIVFCFEFSHMAVVALATSKHRNMLEQWSIFLLIIIF